MDKALVDALNAAVAKRADAILNAQTGDPVTEFLALMRAAIVTAKTGPLTLEDLQSTLAQLWVSTNPGMGAGEQGRQSAQSAPLVASCDDDDDAAEREHAKQFAALYAAAQPTVAKLLRELGGAEEDLFALLVTTVCAFKAKNYTQDEGKVLYDRVWETTAIKVDDEP